MPMPYRTLQNSRLSAVREDKKYRQKGGGSAAALHAAHARQDVTDGFQVTPWLGAGGRRMQGVTF